MLVQGLECYQVKYLAYGKVYSGLQGHEVELHYIVEIVHSISDNMDDFTLL